ncbi:hypothetical protein PENTCL1PPCAC_20524, partial [Pristionchus entomophagus]
MLGEPKPNIVPLQYVHAPGYGGGPNWHSILSMLNTGTLALITVVLNAACGVLILKAVKIRMMSASFRRLQVQLLWALIVQVSFKKHLLHLIMPSVLDYQGQSVGQTGNVMGLIASSFPAIDPICMILAFPRY